MVALAEDPRRPAERERAVQGPESSDRGPSPFPPSLPSRGPSRFLGRGAPYRRLAGGARGGRRGRLGAGTLPGPRSSLGTPRPSMPAPARCAPVSTGGRRGRVKRGAATPPIGPSPARAPLLPPPRLTWGSGGAFSSAAARFPRSPGRGSRESPGVAFEARGCRGAARSIARGSGGDWRSAHAQRTGGPGGGHGAPASSGRPATSG